MKKYEDYSWDFRNSDTKEFTHCFHSYPAMMIPQIARRLIKNYGKNAELLFDPYCGTGTSIVEANLVGIEAIGTDINPLAILISKAKTQSLSLEKLKDYISEFRDFVFQINFKNQNTDDLDIPSFHNIDFWFDKTVKVKLAFISKFINEIMDYAIRDFFLVPFSEVIRESSWTRNSEFKLYRMSEKQREKFNPDVFSIMQVKLNRNLKGLELYYEKRKCDLAKICDFNTIHGIPHKIISDKSVDIVVTSPPYGDSRTTVAYGQFSRLSNQWMGLIEKNNIDNELMGGRRYKEDDDLPSLILNEKLKEIKENDSKRVKDVWSFYYEYNKSIINVAKTVKKDGFICYVVGNRRVKSVFLPTDEITIDFFKKEGFEHVETIIRNIPNKRMPAKNSPTNKSGVLEATMSNEYIVIMKKVTD